MPNYPETPSFQSSPEYEARAAALKRIEAKRGLSSHAVVYLVVNLFLIGIWWFTSPGGYFWPAWVLGGWGIGLAINAWEVLFRRPITEADIEKEMRRGT